MYSEKDIIKPAIDVIRAHGGKCDTADLVSGLTSALDLDDYDLTLLPSGNEIRFDRIVRNLKSHNTLAAMGLCDHYQGGFILTQKGLLIETDELENITVRHFAPDTNLLTPQPAMVEYVNDNNLSFPDRRKAAQDIIKLFKKEPSSSNDFERRETMAKVIEKYIR